MFLGPNLFLKSCLHSFLFGLQECVSFFCYFLVAYLVIRFFIGSFVLSSNLIVNSPEKFNRNGSEAYHTSHNSLTLEQFANFPLMFTSSAMCSKMFCFFGNVLRRLFIFMIISSLPIKLGEINSHDENVTQFKGVLFVVTCFPPIRRENSSVCRKKYP